MAVYTDASAQMCLCVCVCVQLRVKQKEKLRKKQKTHPSVKRHETARDVMMRTGTFSWAPLALCTSDNVFAKLNYCLNVSRVCLGPNGWGPLSLHRFVAKFHRHSCCGCDSEDLCQPLKLAKAEK